MRIFIFLAILACGVVCSSFLLRNFESDKFKIYFDQKLIQGKQHFLSEVIPDPSSLPRPNVIVILADDLGQTDISFMETRLFPRQTSTLSVAMGLPLPKGIFLPRFARPPVPACSPVATSNDSGTSFNPITATSTICWNTSVLKSSPA